MSNKFALLIAVENYHDAKINPVQYAENDATEFAQVLELHGYDTANIEILSSKATKTVIESRLRTILASAQKDDSVIIFYAGHGFAENYHNYITCVDTILGDLKRTSISLQEIMELIKTSECRHIVMFLDSCHSGLDIDKSMRGLLSSMTDEELKKFFKDSEYHVAFASCHTDQFSYSSRDLKHGIWSYHILKAFKGDTPIALERNRFLTSESLQAYLSAEVPRTVRKMYSDTRTQTPRVFGNISTSFLLADFESIFKERAAKLQPNVAQLKRVFFAGEKIGLVKSLSGFNRHRHHVPDAVNNATENFLFNIGQKDLNVYADEIFTKLRREFRYKRNDIDLDSGEGSASIRTNDFTVNILLSLNEDDPSEYIITTEVTEIRNPAAVTSDQFDSVFPKTFSSLNFQFNKQFDIKGLIDAVESINDEKAISVEYAPDFTSCTISSKEMKADIVVSSETFEIRYDSKIKPRMLINSFSDAQKILVGTYGLKMLPF